MRLRDHPRNPEEDDALTGVLPTGGVRGVDEDRIDGAIGPPIEPRDPSETDLRSFLSLLSCHT